MGAVEPEEQEVGEEEGRHPGDVGKYEELPGVGGETVGDGEEDAAADHEDVVHGQVLGHSIVEGGGPGAGDVELGEGVQQHLGGGRNREVVRRLDTLPMKVTVPSRVDQCPDPKLFLVLPKSCLVTTLSVCICLGFTLHRVRVRLTRTTQASSMEPSTIKAMMWYCPMYW